MKRLVPALVLVLAVLPGCAGSLQAARLEGHPVSFQAAPEPSPHCEGLDRDRAIWGAVAVGAAVVSGGSGLGTIPVKGDEGRIALASGVVVGAVVGAVALGLQQSATESWARDCAPPTGGAGK